MPCFMTSWHRQNCPWPGLFKNVFLVAHAADRRELHRIRSTKGLEIWKYHRPLTAVNNL